MNVESLRKLKAVLNDFGQMSGLECNVDKTTLLQVGTVEPISQDIIDLGFSVVNEVTVLGLTITGHGADFSGSLNKIGDKLQKQVTHWSRFNLSLPGRINIAKAMLYSQINYLGCFLPVSEILTTNFSTIIERFACGKLSIARARIYKPVCMGGLGLFRVGDFLDAQRLAWVKRAQIIDDRWKILFYSKSYGSVFNLRCGNYNSKSEPCINAIAISYERFLIQYTRTNENFWGSYMFENKALTTALRDNRLLRFDSFPRQFFPSTSKK
jgi:hypothetical protein